MKKNLLDYVKHYKSFLNDDLCNKTIIELNKLDNSIWEEHLFYDYSKNENIKKSGDKELSIASSEKISTKEIIMKELWNAIYDYINNLGFSWFTGWNGYTSIRFNKYEKDKKINLLKGDLLIFPSIFLYPHKVEPIKKGTRYSFISWVY